MYSGGLHHYLDSLYARADNLLVVVFGAERTCVLALPQEVEGAAVARSLRAVAAKRKKKNTRLLHWIIKTFRSFNTATFF